jgi:hypothetical protein
MDRGERAKLPYPEVIALLRLMLVNVGNGPSGHQADRSACPRKLNIRHGRRAAVKDSPQI